MRAYGLSCDNLRLVEIVTADGMVRRADAGCHADLFWAARGGGRGLGVVTALELALHPLGPDVAAVLVLYPYSDAKAVLRAWRDAAVAAPDSVTPEIALWSIPPLTDVPGQLHGAPVVIVAGLFAGPSSDAGPVLAPLRGLGAAIVDLSATSSYVESQSALDELFPDGGRYYWKSQFVDELTDELLDALLRLDARRPTPQSVIVIRTLRGAIAGVPRRRDRLPASGRRVQRQHRRLLARSGAGRGGRGMGAVELVGAHVFRDRRDLPQLRRARRGRGAARGRAGPERSPSAGDPARLRPRRSVSGRREPTVTGDDDGHAQDRNHRCRSGGEHGRAVRGPRDGRAV